jgi:hypothetical protein
VPLIAWARRNWWVPVLYSLAVIWIYRDLFHQAGVATGLGWDTIDTHGPDLDFFTSELAHGRFSLWNPYDKGGYPLFCDPVYDRYYPINWPFGAWGAVFGTSWWLVQIKVLTHHVIAGVMMHAFVRSRGLSQRAAIVSGLGLVACAPLLLHKASNILWPLVWVPLLWMAVDFALARPSWRRGAAVGAVLLLPMTAGSPPGLFYAGLLVLPYACLRLNATLREPARRTRAELLQLAAAAGTALAIALLVAGVTVVPTGQLVALGSRERFILPGTTFALAMSQWLPSVMAGVFVRGAGLFEFYLGAALVMIAVCSIVLRPRFDRSAAVVFIATGGVGVILASGSSGGLLTLLVHFVPPFDMLRVPGRYKLLAAFSCAAAAGYGIGALEAAIGEVRSRKRVAVVAGLGIVVTVVCIVIAGREAEAHERPPWWSIAATTVAGVLIVGSVWTPRRIADACLAALGVCVLLDAPLFTFVKPAAFPAAEPRQMHENDHLVAKLDGVRDRWRLYDEFVLGERAGARLRIRDFRGYPALDPISLRRYVDVLDYARVDPAIITDFNVRWVLSKPHFRYGADTRFVRVPNVAFEHVEGDFYEARNPAPIVQWVGKVDIVDEQDALAAVRAIEDPDGERRRVVVERDEAGSHPGLYALAAAQPDMRIGRITRYEPDEIRFEVEAPRAGLVVLNEIMFPGWQVTVDGREAAPTQVNHLLRGVAVTSGHHMITWRFAPRGWRLLVGGYVAALVIIAAAAIAARRRRGRR